MESENNVHGTQNGSDESKSPTRTLQELLETSNDSSQTQHAVPSRSLSGFSSGPRLPGALGLSHSNYDAIEPPQGSQHSPSEKLFSIEPVGELFNTPPGQMCPAPLTPETKAKPVGIPYRFAALSLRDPTSEIAKTEAQNPQAATSSSSSPSLLRSAFSPDPNSLPRFGTPAVPQLDCDYCNIQIDEDKNRVDNEWLEERYGPAMSDHMLSLWLAAFNAGADDVLTGRHEATTQPATSSAQIGVEPTSSLATASAATTITSREESRNVSRQSAEEPFYPANATRTPVNDLNEISSAEASGCAPLDMYYILYSTEQYTIEFCALRHRRFGCSHF